MNQREKSVFTFQDLIVWQKAIAFAEKVVLVIDDLNTDRKHYRLIEQFESAATSVAMNIAEGKGRQTTKEFIQYLYIARGSLFETVTLVILFNKLNWLPQKYFQLILGEAEEINKMLNALIKSMRQ